MVLRKGGNFKFASERGGYPEKGGGGGVPPEKRRFQPWRKLPFKEKTLSI